jgi:pSer/pThr/pTyr-binding forkhead associated (FHA) protein
MAKGKEKTMRTKSIDIRDYTKEKAGFSSTKQMSPDTFEGKIPTTQHAYLEIMKEKKERFILEESKVVIGRIPDCDIQLLLDNVSRMHARIIYRNEEYQIEDLDSMNGVYVNGVKVEKCILRSHDTIEIGGIKMLFVEENVRQDYDCK